MTGQKKRVVALLDIDNTLIFGGSSIEYNDALIDTLLENGVNDVYLFSSMTLKQHSIAERRALIDYLRAKTLRVHGAICASDLVWNKDKSLLKTFYQKVNVPGITPDQIFQLFEQEEFHSLTHFDDAVPAQAFAAVNGGITGWNDSEANLYQNVVAAVRMGLARNEEDRQIADSEKSFFYRMFVRNKPAWVGDVIFVDDADVHIQAVKSMHAKLAPAHELLTILNRGEQKMLKNPKPFYHAIIQPFVALFNALNKYKLERIFTYSTTKNENLEQIEKSLKKCKTKVEVDKVRAQFSEQYNQLNRHRFSIWSNAKTRSAMVFDAMVDIAKSNMSA